MSRIKVLATTLAALALIAAGAMATFAAEPTGCGACPQKCATATAAVTAEPTEATPVAAATVEVVPVEAAVCSVAKDCPPECREACLKACGGDKVACDPQACAQACAKQCGEKGDQACAQKCAQTCQPAVEKAADRPAPAASGCCAKGAATSTGGKN
jgi:hypothetical protein